MSNRIANTGTWAAAICAVHCMAMPVIISILPVIGAGWMASEWFEWIGIGLATTICMLGLCWSYPQHKSLKPLFFVVVGGIWFVLGHSIAPRHFHCEHIDWHTMMFPMLGGACFVIANWLNHRLCKTCVTCCGHSHGKVHHSPQQASEA